MPFTSAQPPALKLSICITTLNRAAFIGATLDSILSQVTEDCEVVVLDGASTDDTERVVSNFTRRFDCLRYVRQETNNGIDRDYNRVVELARGEYCWLMTDDDLLKPGAIIVVLEALRLDVSLVIINAEAKDFTMSKVVQRRLLDFELDRVYGPGEMDRLFVEVGNVFRYVGAVVIKRAIWIAREKEQFYGTLFTHVGVIFQEPLPGKTLVIANPLISYRMDNTHTFSSKAFETCLINWPSLVWSLPLSALAKSQVSSVEPWRSFQEVLLWRGLDSYSMTEYRLILRPRLRSIRKALTHAFVARLPGALVNTLVVFYYSVTRRRYQGVWSAEYLLHALRNSRFHLRNWRVFNRKS